MAEKTLTDKAIGAVFDLFSGGFKSFLFLVGALLVFGIIGLIALFGIELVISAATFVVTLGGDVRTLLGF